MPKRKASRAEPSTALVPAAAKRGKLAPEAWVRRQAGIDYITDPRSRSVHFHFHRTDRPYKEHVNHGQFELWSIEDKWTERREKFWAEAEQRVLEAYQDKLFKMRLDELQRMTELRDEIERFLRPVRNDAGDLVIDPATGLPKMALRLGSYDKMVDAFLKLDERIMLRRGEATSRTDTRVDVSTGEEPFASATSAVDDPVAKKLSFDTATLRAMARAALEAKQPAPLSEAIEVAPVHEESDDD